jgi:hypothetical protein
MSEREERLRLIGDIMVAEEYFMRNEVKKDKLWHNNRFDVLYEETLLTLQLKKNLLMRKVNNGQNS